MRSNLQKLNKNEKSDRKTNLKAVDENKQMIWNDKLDFFLNRFHRQFSFIVTNVVKIKAAHFNFE